MTGNSPLTVDFIDKSVGINGIASWDWDFNNDGAVDLHIDATEPPDPPPVTDPSHQYTSLGTYTVSLTVTDQNGATNTKTRNAFINVYGFGTVSGKVTDEVSGDAVGGAHVYADYHGSGEWSPGCWVEADTYTNESGEYVGEYTLTGLEDGSYYISACRRDYLCSDYTEVHIDAGASIADIDLVMPRDTDNDHTGDTDDNCPYDFNPRQEDMDFDGVGDLCDTDTDDDGVDNELDNCWRTENADQIDTDGDGYGDACREVHCVNDSQGLRTYLSGAQGNDKDDVIRLEQGTYGISVTYGEFSYTSSEPWSLIIEGGYTAGCAERNINPSNTILDGLYISQGQTSGGVLKYIDNGHSYYSQFVLDGVTVRRGVALSGAGIYADGENGTIILKNNVIEYNDTSWYTGGASSRGAGVYAAVHGGNVTLANNVVKDNTARYYGGVYAQAEYGEYGNIYLTNNTILENSANSRAGVCLDLGETHVATLYNNIIRDNVGGTGSDIYFSSGEVVAYNNNFDPADVYGTFTEQAENINVDPQFVATEDYHLSSESECIDAGSDVAPWLPLTDFEGDDRALGLAPDMGADEYYGEETIYAISGQVLEDEVGLDGVVIDLVGGTYTDTEPTDNDGNYQFTEVPYGAYTITPSKTGYSFDPADRTVTLAGHNPIDQHFTASPVDTDGDGVPDATDNCPLVQNPTQDDCNSNAVGDACDPINPTADDSNCNGIDDNCNGVADDAYVPTQSNCGVGACASTGALECVGGQVVDTCVPGTPSAEICDGADNDCDGSIADDGVDESWFNEPTTCGVGECESEGILICEAGAQVDTCEEGTPNAEICDDTLDNDCDGDTDCDDSDCVPCTRYVDDTNCSDSNPGTLELPYCTINKAIQEAFDDDTIIVRDGTYTGAGNKDLDFGGKAITIMSENGPENSIIDCQGSGRGFYFHNGEAADSVLDGFTIINGSVSGNGGAILCQGASPTITNCIISGNSAANGGGIACFNTASPSLTNCVVSGNEAVTYGGGVHFSACSAAEVTNCTFGDNSASVGGGISCYATSLAIENCILWRDSATNGPAYGPELAIGLTGNCSTVSVSYSDVKGGASSVAVASGCTLNWNASTNINANPKFVQPYYWDGSEWNIGNYHLAWMSPCIDAGTDAGIGADMDGDERPYDAPGVDNNGSQPEFDMGADEYVGFDELCLILVPGSVIISRGGTLTYTAMIGNPTASAITFDYWTNLTLPNGNPYPSSGPLIGPYESTLNPSSGQSQQFTYPIPSNAPLGLYIYNAFIGDYPSSTNEYHFNFEVRP